jgi:hypothetical protein
MASFVIAPGSEVFHNNGFYLVGSEFDPSTLDTIEDDGVGRVSGFWGRRH